MIRHELTDDGPADFNVPGRARRLSCIAVSAASLAAVMAVWATCVGAQEVSPPAAIAGPASPRESIVITAKVPPEPSDADLTQRVQTVLLADPYLDSSNVKVTARSGIVTLEGMVGDPWDLLRAMRISNKVAGVRRVDDELEIFSFDGGN